MFETVVLLIVGLPLLAAIVNGLSLFAGDRLGYRVVQNVTCGAVILSFIGCLWVASQYAADPGPRNVLAWQWFSAGDFKVNVSFLIDSLSLVMMLVVTGFSSLIAVYSRNYMHNDYSFTRYFTCLALFVFAMLVLVMGSNFVLLFLGWEAVGVCSYLLIGHYYDRPSAARAGTKAFLLNRVGDAGFLMGIFLIARTFGTVEYAEVFAKASALDSGTATAISLCLLLGAIGKSAQLPLGTWLARAMEGPTPSRALIHAATMVTAGVYMIARSHAIYDAAPNAMLVVALVGLFTALYGSLVGQTVSDIKGILAYSTTTQLGLMFVACGLGAYTVAVFHLVAHAFLKTFLFLTAPSILHHLHGKADPGATEARVPFPFAQRLMLAVALGFLIAPLALGWWSGTEGAGNRLPEAVLLAAFALSILITLYQANTLGQRVAAAHAGGGAGHAHGDGEAHSSSISLGGPIFVLLAAAGIAAFTGLLPGVSLTGWLGQLLAGSVVDAPPSGANAWLVGTVAAATGLALLVAWFSGVYLQRFAAELPGLRLLRLRGLYTAALNRFWLEEVYDSTIAGGVQRLGSGLERIDKRVVDRIVGLPLPASRITTVGQDWERNLLGAQSGAAPAAAATLEGEAALGGGLAAMRAWLSRQENERRTGISDPELRSVPASSEGHAVGRASGFFGGLVQYSAAIAGWLEHVIFGRGIHEGLPHAGGFFGHMLVRFEALLERPAASSILILAGVLGAAYFGVSTQ